MKTEPEKQGGAAAEATAAAGDVVFECPQCGVSMIVDRVAEGLTVDCARCHAKVTVPSASPRSQGGSSTAQELIRENLELRTQLQQLETQQQEIRARLTALPQRVSPVTVQTPGTPSGEVNELRHEIAAMRSLLAGIVDRQRDEYINLVRTGLDEARESRRQNDEMLRLIVEITARNGRPVRADEPQKDSNGREERKKQVPISLEIERLKGELRDARADLFRLTAGAGWQPAPAPAGVGAAVNTASASLDTASAAPPATVENVSAERSDAGNGTDTAETIASGEHTKSRKGRRRRMRAYIGMLLPCLIFIGVLGVVWRVFTNKTQALATATPVNIAAPHSATPDPALSKPAGEENEADSPEKQELKEALRLAQDGKLTEAITTIRGTLERDPSSVDARHWLAALLAEQGQRKEAIAEYRQVLSQSPDHIGTLNNLAYLLATDPDETLRSGKEAVELASRAWTLSSQRNPSILDTLAAAYAESGKFPEAVTAAKSAVAMAMASRNSVVADQIRSRLQWYEMGFPYRDNTQRAIRKAVEPEAKG